MSTKKINSNTEKNTNTEKNQELTDLYPDLVIEKIKVTNDKINQLYDMLHRLIENPYKVKSADKLLKFSFKLKNKIEIPYYLSNIVFEESVRVTGIEIEGSTLYFDYEVNDIDNYRYYVILGADKLITKEFVLIRYIFEHMEDNDFVELSNTMSEIIARIDNERKYILQKLKDSNVKIES